MSKNTRYIFFILFVGFVFNFHCSISASLKFERFSNKEGFNQNTITDIEQDKYGYLWFATPNGLIKYDGYDFISYTNDPFNENSISNNYIHCLYNDEKGVLWVGTMTDVDVYIPQLEKFIRVPLKSELIVTQISADSEGKIWILGENALLTCELIITENEISFIVSENFLETEPNPPTITDFCFINDYSLLFSNSEGLFRMDFEAVSSNNKLKIKAVRNYSLLSVSDIKVIRKIENIFWVGTGSGLFKTILDGDQMRIIEKVELYSHDKRVVSDLNILSIFQDKQGDIWIGSAEESIFKYDKKNDSFENYAYSPKDETGISSPRINCFFEDRFGVFWIGTAHGGINKLDAKQKQFINYSNNPYSEVSISGNLINGILEDSKGKLWVSNYNESICRSIESVNENNIGRLRFERLQNHPPLKKGDLVNTIYEDQKGFMWFGGNNIISVYNTSNNLINKIDLKHNGESVPVSRCMVIFQIDEESILFGGQNIVIAQNPWKNILNGKYSPLEVISVNNQLAMVQVFLKDRNGNFWVGTNNGLFKCDYKDKVFKILQEYSVKENNGIKLSHNDIFSLHEDNAGNIWIGTFGGGLNKMVLNETGTPVKIDYFRKNGLLPDDAVYGILQEDDEHLWISTDMGLCRIYVKENKIDIFDVRDGLPNNNFRQLAYHKGKSGYYYFGGLNGLTIFKPENIKLNNIVPNSVITAVNINNKQVNIGEKMNGKIILKKSILETNEITIKHGARIITFNLAAQQSTTPSKNKIAYMLEGFNNDWTDTNEGKASITYTNLPAGKFVLRVKSANSDGLWNNQTTDLRISVLPPWYQTWWSFIIFAILIIAISVTIFVYFIRHEKLKQSLKYEQIDKQRIDSINEGRLRFFTNISHEFRTPLTLIAGPLEQIVKRNKDRENVKYLAAIQNNTKRLLSLADQLITFRKAEQGHLNLNLSADTLGHFIYPATEAFEDYAIQKNINFFYKINSPNEEVVIDVEKTERIIFNLLSNSFRNTLAHGNISIETDIVSVADKKMISIKVIDTGNGIPAEKQERIFERFYQLEGRKENVGGTGIGLAFCKSLIDLMGGTFSVESEPNVRTCFTVLIPSKNIEKNNPREMVPKESFIKDWIPIQVPLKNNSLNGLDTKTKIHSLLIVEDEADVRDFLLNALGEKYTIILAENGVDGLNKIKQNEPDLVISDVMMPEMNGFEMCEEIKSNSETCHIPVILLTALNDKENEIKGFEFRADDYIGKPFSMRHLEIRVERLIENNYRVREHFSKNSGIPDKDIEISTRDKKFLRLVIDAIENNLSNSNFGVEELAKEIGLSPSQFYRRLKQLTGQIPNVYLRNYRLQRAAELLTNNEGLNVAEVMYQVGIESNSYFSTSFKKLHGISPSDFLRKNKMVD